jgi:hypothetical protein
VAHHSGVERADALAVLRRVDRQIGRIVSAARDAPRPYRFVVLSDHGQSQGETFVDRYGISLQDLVQNACQAEAVHAEDAHSDEALGYLGASLTEASGSASAGGRAVGAVTRRRRVNGAVQLGKGGPEAIEDGELPELSVMASGCLGLITFPREPGRVTLERIDHLWPNLIPALRDHPGIGFLLVRSERRGATVIGSEGTNYLDEDHVEGADPLAPFGPNAPRHVARTDGFAHCPDIVANSTYWADTDEVAAFEELVGSHGGMGGDQSFPFALVPADWGAPEAPIVGAESMHARFREWLADLGHATYRERTAA